MRANSFRRLADWLGWNRTSGVLIGGFFLLLFLIGYIWWPLAAEYLASYNPAYPWWAQVDWLLIGVFLVMSLLITSRPDLRRDLPILLVGLAGGAVIETWGTNADLWAYYTGERPPLWILPAWPIASLAIERITRMLNDLFRRFDPRVFSWSYPPVFGLFFLLMALFVRPGLDSPLTWGALLLCAFLLLTQTDKRAALIIFTAGVLLGYFLERWGTTRECWVYYTRQTPPLFAVLAHGMAAVAFERSKQALGAVGLRLTQRAAAGWRSRVD
jgi:hypothetical protein